jgi:hypothetical protein
MPAYFDSGLIYWPTLPLDLALVHLLGLRRKAIEKEIERARAEQLDIARSWILLFTLGATFGLWWVFYNQLKLDFAMSASDTTYSASV